jgi:hypothetical protein
MAKSMAKYVALSNAVLAFDVFLVHSNLALRRSTGIQPHPGRRLVPSLARRPAPAWVLLLPQAVLPHLGIFSVTCNTCRRVEPGSDGPNTGL